MKARIKIDEVVSRCKECPFFSIQETISGFDPEMGPNVKVIKVCAYLENAVPDPNSIPNWCPFLLEEEG